VFANFTTPAVLRPIGARAASRLYGRSAMAEPGVAVEHPNRKKASSKATRLIVVLLLLASAFLLIVITIGAWDALAGAKPLQIIWIVVYVVLAFFVARWSRGVLPLAAALAIVLFIFALVSVPGWFERDKDGFTDPALASDVVGLLTALLVPLQLLLIAFAMRGFQQAWNVEVEHPAERGGGHRADTAPAPA
jgi:presenilin-like A22 family membrane protease